MNKTKKSDEKFFQIFTCVQGTSFVLYLKNNENIKNFPCN